MTNELIFSYDNGLPYKKTYIPVTTELFEQNSILTINAIMGEDFLKDGKITEFTNPNNSKLKVFYGDDIQIWFLLENEYLHIPNIPLGYAHFFKDRNLDICLSDSLNKERLIIISI